MTALLAPILQEFFTAHLVTQRAVECRDDSGLPRHLEAASWPSCPRRENVPAHKLETNHVDRNCR